MAGAQLSGVTKRYGDAVAVEDVTLQVEDGEFLVLLGPSGCGKTTTLRIVGGFVEATSGTVRIGGRDVTREPPYRRNIGLVFQNYALFPHLTVFENVAFGLRRRRIAEKELRQRVSEALALVRLAAFGERLPRQLSGGQQQRVAIARALVIEPDVLLLDEPLSNLDAKLRHDVRNELRKLQQTLKLTTIMVTHDQDEAMGVGDRLVVMNAGRIQQIGTPAELYRTPANRFVASFIGRANFIDGKVEAGGTHFVTSSGLRLPSGRLKASDDVLMIRPEAITVAKGGSGGQESIPAVIETATFLGAAHEIELKLAGGEKLSVVTPARAGAEDWTAGDSVFLTIDPAAAVGMRGADQGPSQDPSQDPRIPEPTTTEGKSS